MKKLIIALALTLSATATTKLPEIKLEGDNGGRLDKSAWSSSEIKGKVYVLFYVDPDEKDLNNHVSSALKAENFPLDKYASIAVINMAATWKPNFAIANALKEKQKEFPNTLYLKDLNKVLVDKWQLKDDSSNVVLFNKKGEMLQTIKGKATADQIKAMITAIRANLNS